MKTDEQLYFALGLAQKAGKLASGDLSLTEALKEGRGKYVVIAGDVSSRTEEKITALCQAQQVPFTKRLDMASLGRAIGRAPRAAVVILDENFMKLMV
jgi:ribosomal protein L7Ae-like RNA K-turn-binding protein